MDQTAHPPIVKSLHWRDEADTQAFAQALAAQPALQHAYVDLRGELGAGKTTLVRHLLRALGVSGPIKSPTYAVVEPYELSDLAIWHFDFYRFQDPREADEAGLRDIFARPGLKLSEWSQNAAGYLPRADLVVELEVLADESRQVTLTAHSGLGQNLILGVDP